MVGFPQADFWPGKTFGLPVIRAQRKDLTVRITSRFCRLYIQIKARRRRCLHASCFRKTIH